MRQRTKVVLVGVLAAASGVGIGGGFVYTAMSGLGSPGHEVQGLIDAGEIRLGGSTNVLDGMKTRDDAIWERGGVRYEVRAFTDRPRIIVFYIRDAHFIAGQAIGDGDQMWLFMDHEKFEEFVTAITPVANGTV